MGVSHFIGVGAKNLQDCLLLQLKRKLSEPRNIANTATLDKECINNKKTGDINSIFHSHLPEEFHETPKK